MTTNVTFAECERVPLTPVIVNGYVPATVEVLVVILSVEEPEPLNELGLNVAVTPAGAPLTVSATLALKPLLGVTVAV